MVVDISGDVIAGGVILGLGIPQKLSGDFAVVKLRGSDGFFPPLSLFAPQNTAQRKCINEPTTTAQTRWQASRAC